jgi:hypothetical protein
MRLNAHPDQERFVLIGPLIHSGRGAPPNNVLKLHVAITATSAMPLLLLLPAVNHRQNEFDEVKTR